MDLFTLSAKLTLDSSEFDRDIGSAEQKGSSLGEKLSGVGSVVSKGFQVAGAAATAAITAVSGLAKSAIDAYANYEQLTGGVETLFDTSADTVISYAQKAYLTAGVSMNTYLEQVTSFAASLNRSTKDNFEQSAEIANRAMISMSDNANKFGTDIESIQNAYQSFAKGQYQLLDNLKLGYNGTITEAKRLVKEASKMTAEQEKLGVKIQANSLDFANFVNAIAVVQEHLGIAGTTENEALTTISGSIGLLQASWENLKTTIVDPNGDISGAIDAVVFSAKMAFNNLIPAIKQALTGIGSAIAEIAPVIAGELPSLISDVLPSMVTAASSLLDGFVNAIVTNTPTVISGAVEIVSQLASAIIDNVDGIIDAAGQIVDSIASVFEADNVEKFVSAGLSILTSIFNGIVDNIGTITQAAISIISGLATGIAENLPELIPVAINALLEFASAIIENIDQLYDAASALIDGLAAGLVQALPVLIQKAPEIIAGLLKAFVENVPKLIEAGVQAITSIVQGITDNASLLTDAWEQIKESVVEAWNSIKAKGDEIWASVLSALTAVWNGIKQVAINLWNDIKSNAESIWNAIKNFITTPIEKVKTSLSTAWESIKTTAENAWNNIKTAAETAWNNFKNAVIQPIQTVIDKIQELLGLKESKTITVTTVYKTVGTVTTSAGSVDLEVLEDGYHFDPWGGGVVKDSFAKGEWNVPYDDYPALLHRGERVLTASQARQSDDGVDGTTFDGLVSAVVQAIREGMQGVQVNSYLDGRELTDAVNRYQGEDLTAGRFA